MPARLKLRQQSACKVFAGSVHIQEKNYFFADAVVVVDEVSNPLKMMEDGGVSSETYSKECLGVTPTLDDNDRTFLRFFIEHAYKTA